MLNINLLGHECVFFGNLSVSTMQLYNQKFRWHVCHRQQRNQKAKVWKFQRIQSYMNFLMTSMKHFSIIDIMICITSLHADTNVCSFWMITQLKKIEQLLSEQSFEVSEAIKRCNDCRLEFHHK